MIPYINDRLNRWSEWLRTGHTRLGYPRQAAFVSAMVRRGEPSGAVPLPDEEAMHVCSAVNALEPSLRATVECFYVSMRSCTAADIGRHLGCSRDTVYSRIDRAHIHILGFLNDIAAGLPVAPWAEKMSA